MVDVSLRRRLHKRRRVRFQPPLGVQDKAVSVLVRDGVSGADSGRYGRSIGAESIGAGAQTVLGSPKSKGLRLV